MFARLFNIILDMVASLVQLVMLPFNILLYKLLPDFSNQITQITNVFNNVFNGITWGLGALPKTLITTLIFVLSIEVIKITTYISVKSITKIWTLIQKLKFW